MTAPIKHPSHRDFGARYRVAVQPWYGRVLQGRDVELRTSGRMTNHDLDLLNGKGLHRLRCFLQSAFGGLKGDPMVEARDKAGCSCIIDSGGYQISTGAMRYSELQMFELLKYCEKFEAAPILDGPTSSLSNPKSILKSLRQCLEFTIENGLYAIKYRRPGKTRLMNVIQGLNKRQAIEWYQAVKFMNDRTRFGDRALEDWAFAGATRLHFSIVLTLLIMMRDDQLILPGAYLHFLGTGHPELACVLSAVQDGLRQTVSDDIQVSFDSATPFVLAGKFQRAFGEYRFSKRELLLPVVPMPSGSELVGSDTPWPVQSPFAERLTLGDLNVRSRERPQNCWDDLSHLFVTAHNIWAITTAIDTTLQKLSLPLMQALKWLPSSLIEHAEIVREILRSEHPLSLINVHQPLLDSRAHKGRHTALADPCASLGV